jgi:hypothetical protein
MRTPTSVHAQKTKAPLRENKQVGIISEYYATHCVFLHLYMASNCTVHMLLHNGTSTFVVSVQRYQANQGTLLLVGVCNRFCFSVCFSVFYKCCCKQDSVVVFQLTARCCTAAAVAISSSVKSSNSLNVTIIAIETIVHVCVLA